MSSNLAVFKETVQNLPAARSGKGKVIFIVDATASREATWSKTMDLQFKAFDAMKGLEVQLVYFRGDRKEKEIKASPFIRKPDVLRRLMGKIECIAGSTQIVRALTHVRVQQQSNPAAAVVYVGDVCEDNHAVAVEAAHATGVRVFVLHETDDYKPRGSRATDRRDDDEDENVLCFKRMAEATGGAYTVFSSKNSEMGEMMAEVARYVGK